MSNHFLHKIDFMFRFLAIQQHNVDHLESMTCYYQSYCINYIKIVFFYTLAAALEPELYGGLVYKLKRILCSNNFSTQFMKLISHYKKIGYNINVL